MKKFIVIPTAFIVVVFFTVLLFFTDNKNVAIGVTISTSGLFIMNSLVVKKTIEAVILAMTIAALAITVVAVIFSTLPVILFAVIIAAISTIVAVYFTTITNIAAELGISKRETISRYTVQFLIILFLMCSGSYLL